MLTYACLTEESENPSWKKWIRCQQARLQWIHEKGCHGLGVHWVLSELMWQCGGDRPHMEGQGCGWP